MRSPSHATLAATLWPVGGAAGLARPALLALAGSLLLAVSAKVQVPFVPVPLTMQTLVVLLVGSAYGLRLGVATVALYLAEGLAGLPVFAGAAAGPAYAMGPTGGFLAGFLLAAALTGLAADRGWDRSLGRVLLAMAAGHALIFACGFGWLAHLVGPAKAWALGVAPFALATLLKTALAAALVMGSWSLAARRGPAA